MRHCHIEINSSLLALTLTILSTIIIHRVNNGADQGMPMTQTKKRFDVHNITPQMMNTVIPFLQDNIKLRLANYSSYFKHLFINFK